jgi:MFS family permease
VATPTQRPPEETKEAPEQQQAAVMERGATGSAEPKPALAVAEAVEAHGDAEDQHPTEKTPTLMEKVQAFRGRYATWEMALFFFAGFIYDVFTLGRIDDRLNLLSQGAYLAVLGGLLLLEQKWSGEVQPPPWMQKAWRFSEDALHFLFGSLLSAYTLFYFKSASGVTALLFLLALFALLVGNELPRFRSKGPVVRVGLYSFCLTSYFAYLLPVVMGFLSGWLFFLSVVLASAVVFGLFHLVRKWNAEDTRVAMQRVAVTGFGVQGLLLVLYLLSVIPPVPLSVEYSGIYHNVEKRNGPKGREYLLHHERADWKFWQRGDQDFRVRPGDKAWFFVRIFAPTDFEDRVTFRWYYDDPKKGWTERSAFKTGITGGREQGFRTMAYTSNPAPGDWYVTVETEDGREIGRMSFTVETDERKGPRDFQVDKDA